MINYLSRTYWPKTMGGAEKYIHEIRKRTDKEYETRLYTWDETSEKNTTIIKTPKIKIIGSIIFSLKASKIINQKKGLTHVSQYWSEYAPLMIKKEFVTTIYDLPKNKLKRMIIKKGLNRAKKIFYISKGVKEELIKMGLQEEKLVYAPPGVNETRIAKSKRDKNTLLYISRIAPNKDLITILRAIKEIDCKLIIAGQKMEWTNYYQKVIQEIRKLKLENKVLMLGVISEEEKNKLLQKSTAYVQASTSGEGFGMPIIEAQKAGLPVITSDLFEEIGVVKKDHDASVFKKGDANELKNQIQKVLNNSKYCEKITNNGLKNAKQYNWDKTAKTVINTYKTLL